MTSEGHARNLSQSGGSALLGLLRTIVPDVVPKDREKLSELDIRNINEKLTELLGKDVAESYNQDGNLGGELVNEEGLPIIDVRESSESADSRATGTAIIAEEDTLISLVSMPESERARLRQERDQILLLLEEEEKLEEQRERERLMEESKEFIQKKLEEAEHEKGRALAAKELQRKMAKRFIDDIGRHSGTSKVDDELPSKSPKPKKSVTFATDVIDSEQESMGDISLASLRKTNRPTLLDTIGGDRQPMKANVVERKSVAQSTTKIKQSVIMADSDDESNPDEDEDEEERKDRALYSARSSEDSASESDDLHEGLEDLDFAQHQRAIAIEYYAKRGIIGQAAAQAMMTHSHEDEDEREIPPDTGVTEPQSKPPFSRFKASKLASSYNTSLPSESRSLDGSLLTASSATTLQQAIRMGKLDTRGQLVGTNEDGESEPETEAVQEAIELLKKGEVYNIGPEDDQILHTVSPPEKEELRTVTTAHTALPILNKLRSSKFKVDRSQAGPSRTGQNLATRVSADPEVSTTQASVPAVMERRSPGTTIPFTNGTLQAMRATTDSSSLPGTIYKPAEKQRPQVVDSPFKKAVKGTTHPTPFSMIIDSPSFPPPRETTRSKSNANPPSLDHPATSINQIATARRPNRPPVVMSSAVVEKSKQVPSEFHDQSEAEAAPRPKKVSRFLAERM